MYTSRERRQHSKTCVQQKLTTLKCCARPSSMEHFKCTSGVGLPHRYPEHLATPFWLPQKCKKKKKGTGVPPVFAFSTKNSGRYRRPYKKMPHLLFCPFWRCFFPLFFASFSSFFALIRATLGFFVVFPNKSYTLMRATFESYV